MASIPFGHESTSAPLPYVTAHLMSTAIVSEWILTIHRRADT
jgi:hypothetical protein